MNTMASLPEPRTVTAVDHPLLDAAMRSREALSAALNAALRSGDDAGIRSALQGSRPEVVRQVWQTLADVIDGQSAGIGLRLFAIPLLLICGARAPLGLPGAVPDIGNITALLERHGAVGATRNFGLGNALCDWDALDGLSPAALWRATRDPAQRGIADGLRPAPVAVDRGREQVHLRFLAGAGVTPQHLPSFLESASNIATWGMPLTQELTRQLAQPGLEVLPIPRPPVPLAKAAYSGRCAQLEAALNLFLSNTVRRFRMSVGDPEAVLSAHALPSGAGELRLSLSSPFDESMLEGFCWPLHPLDTVDEVSVIFQRTLTDFRLGHVTQIGRVLAATLDRNMMFIPGRMSAELQRTN